MIKLFQIISIILLQKKFPIKIAFKARKMLNLVDLRRKTFSINKKIFYV